MEKKMGGGVPLLIRWTTEFDCSKETDWWYCIKDAPFDINSLKSKRRYEINKGKKNFSVEIINPKEYKEEIYIIQKLSYLEYPKKYRPKVIKNLLYQAIENWSKSNCKIYGAFDKKNNLCGYALISFENEKWINFVNLKVDPEFEKLGINAAIVSKILEDINPKIKNGAYICDGERNIFHKTKFQNYLEKYFEFKKVYCKLNIEYQPVFEIIINILYPFRNFLKYFDNISFFNRVNTIIQLESIRRRMLMEDKKVDK